MSTITIDHKACTRCGACVRACAIARVYEFGEATVDVAQPEACWRCGHCVSVCPTDAIDHDAFPFEKSPLLVPSRQPSIEQVVQLVRARRSSRAYAERPVSREVVRELTSASRYAPTAENVQDVDWIAIDDPARLRELSKATIDRIGRFAAWARRPVIRSLLALVVGREAVRSATENPELAREMVARWTRGDDPIFYNAPVLLIATTRSGGAFRRDNAVFAAYNVMLAAEALGLTTCEIGLFQVVLARSRKLRLDLAIPDGRSPELAMILGYPFQPYRRLVPRRMPDVVWNPR
ncbi:MAG: nitroreductase family protein [Candidatus Bipolaricaulota bacterium]